MHVDFYTFWFNFGGIDAAITTFMVKYIEIPIEWYIFNYFQQFSYTKELHFAHLQTWKVAGIQKSA